MALALALHLDASNTSGLAITDLHVFEVALNKKKHKPECKSTVPERSSLSMQGKKQKKQFFVHY